MIAFLKRLKPWDILWAVGFVGLIWFLYSGLPEDSPVPRKLLGNSVVGAAYGLIAVLLIASAVAGQIPYLAVRERRCDDGFEWRRPPVRYLIECMAICWFFIWAGVLFGFAEAFWTLGDWTRISVSAAMGLFVTVAVIAVLIAQLRQVFGSQAVLRVTSEGLTVGDRTVDWSDADAVVFGRYRWHEFGVQLADSNDRRGREWWFSLRDAGIEAPHFLDRLERVAPQVTVLKPEGEPMRGARPIPAV
jgi:hypothetical protein